MREARATMARLRKTLGEPLEKWREIYEGFAPRDLESGERRSRVAQPGRGHRRAAVLIPVVGGTHVIYTLRRGHLPDHAGQISFPGGSIEPSDESPLAAALREAEEEINLPPEDVEVIGELEELYIPASNFLVSPFVGAVPSGAELTLCPAEVEEVFAVFLEDLLEPGSFQRRVWRREGQEYEVPLFCVDGREIWGATAAMTAGLLARLGWRMG
jgi:8-oxo-dGTP pyrophosphatase MutT (NUDIX family)